MLIRTKLQPPPLRFGLLYRKKLIQRLSTAESYPLILISATAGSGKTSLICQWISEAPLKVAWYSLDQEDNVPDLFFRYLLGALGRIDAQFNRSFAPLIASQRALSGSNVVAHLITSFSEVQQDIHLVLDDFHHITDMEIIDAFARLLQYLPNRLHLVILSRHRLPVSVSAAGFKKERLEIPASDLKFTDQETRELFNKMIPITFSTDLIPTLNRHVEGWAAGLQLIGLFIRSKGSAVDLSNILKQVHDQVAGYLIHDILRFQPEKLRNFIFATVLLERFNSELCVELTGCDHGGSMIARLARMNLFLIPLDIEGKWYRYHHIFSEVLRRQISIDNPDMMSATLRSAATWFAKNHYLEDALRSAFRSKDFEFAADLMEDHLLQYVEAHHPMAGIRWILRLPGSVLDQRGLLKLYQCGCLLFLMEHTAAKEIFFDLEANAPFAFERYSGPKRVQCEEYRARYNGLMQIFNADKNKDTAQIQDLKPESFMQHSPSTGGNELLTIFICISNGNFSLAEKSLAKVSALPVWSLSMPKKLNFVKAEALIARHRGQLHHAEAILNKAVVTFAGNEPDRISMAFLLYRHLGYIFYLQNKLEKAKEYDAIVAQHNEHAGLFDEIMTGFELRFLLHLAAGETEAAALRIQQIRAFSAKLNRPEVVRSAEANAARLAIENDRPAAAKLWAEQRRLHPDEPFSMLYAMECLTLARLYFALKRYSDAVHILKPLRNRCRKRGLEELMLQIDILSAAVFHALNQPKTAMSFLQKALIFSETEGYLRPFVNDAPLIAPILRRITDEQPRLLSTAHLEEIFIACDLPLAGFPAAQKLNNLQQKNLTIREVEILKWMAQGLQNKEIARKAFVSINTVKYHVRNVLAKLSVKTRYKAIIKAKEMNIL